MKLRNWEKITGVKGLNYWRMKHSPYTEVRVIYPHEPIPSLRKPYHERWWVEIDDILVKDFPSKKQAMAYAMVFMRRHRK